MIRMLFNFMAALIALNISSIETASAGNSHFKKVIWIVLENADYAKAMSQPDLVALAKKGTLFTNFSAETHPSQGNYISMIAGDPMGVSNDNAANLQGAHLGDLLEAAHLDWKVYAEDYPGNCFLGDTQKLYARKHVPFLSFLNVSTDSERCKKIVNADQFDKDVAANLLPEYTMYTPNLRDDGHNTGSDYSAPWFAKRFSNLINSGLKDTLIVLTFDESENRRNSNKIYTLALGESVQAGAVNSQPLNHVSLLKLIEDEFGLGDLGRGDRTAPVINNLWKN